MTNVRDETLKIHKRQPIPQPIKILFVAESPPFSFSENNERYFYAPGKIKKRGLFYHMMSVIFDEFSASADLSSKEHFLKKFEEKGYYLIDMVKCPFDQFKKEKKRKRSAINSCAKNLKNDLKSLKFEKIVFIGKISFKIFEKYLDPQLKPEVLPLPFNSQKNSNDFKAGLKNILATAE